MLRLGNENLESARGFKGLLVKNSKFKTQKQSALTKAIFNLCAVCSLAVMASIPPSAFSAGRIRETQRGLNVSTTKTTGGSKQYFNNTNMEPSPLKYNSKLMNSIWGFYNRYSPHNVKNVNDASPVRGEFQQDAANSSTNKNESKFNFEKIWAAVTLPQSH